MSDMLEQIKTVLFQNKIDYILELIVLLFRTRLTVS